MESALENNTGRCLKKWTWWGQNQGDFHIISAFSTCSGFLQWTWKYLLRKSLKLHAGFRKDHRDLLSPLTTYTQKLSDSVTDTWLVRKNQQLPVSPPNPLSSHSTLDFPPVTLMPLKAPTLTYKQAILSSDFISQRDLIWESPVRLRATKSSTLLPWQRNTHCSWQQVAL